MELSPAGTGSAGFRLRPFSLPAGRADLSIPDRLDFPACFASADGT